MMNAVGYQVFFSAISLKINSDLDFKISEGKLAGIDKIIFKKPVVSLPYLPTKPFESDLNGELTYNGNIYRYVKSILKNDTLYYECVLNQKAKSIDGALSNYFKFNTGQTTKSEKSTVLGQKIFKDYLANTHTNLPKIACFNLKNSIFKHYSAVVLAFNIENPSPPPRLFS